MHRPSSSSSTSARFHLCRMAHLHRRLWMGAGGGSSSWGWRRLLQMRMMRIMMHWSSSAQRGCHLPWYQAVHVRIVRADDVLEHLPEEIAREGRLLPLQIVKGELQLSDGLLDLLVLVDAEHASKHGRDDERDDRGCVAAAA